MIEQYFEAQYTIRFASGKDFDAFKEAFQTGASLRFFGPEAFTFEEGHKSFPLFDLLSVNLLEPAVGQERRYQKDKAFSAVLHYGGIKFVEYDEETQQFSDIIPNDPQHRAMLRADLPRLLEQYREKGICKAFVAREDLFTLDDYEALLNRKTEEEIRTSEEIEEGKEI